jgi:hypothetical protein
MFLFRQKTYEIQACRKGRWTIEQTSGDAADAETAAKALFHKLKDIEAVRVILDGPGDKVLFEQKKPTGAAPVVVPQIEEAPVCTGTEDLYGPGARKVVNRLFRQYLDRAMLTPTEIMHNGREMKRLMDFESIVQTAIDRVARVQKGATPKEGAAPKDAAASAADEARGRRDDLWKMVEGVSQRARAADKLQLPTIATVGFDEAVKFVCKTAKPDELKFMLRCVFSRELSNTRSWYGKLSQVLEWTNSSRESAGLVLLDDFISDTLASPQLIQDILGQQPSLADALIKLLDIADGTYKGPSKGQAAEMAGLEEMLCRLMKTGRLPASRDILIERVRGELRGGNPLARNNPETELTRFDEIVERLLVDTGVAGGAGMAEALVQRATSFLNVGGASGQRDAVIWLTGRSPSTLATAHFLLTMAGSKMAPALQDVPATRLEALVGEISDLAYLVAGETSPIAQLKSVTALFRAVESCLGLAPESSKAITARIDDLLFDYVVRGKIVEQMDNPAWKLHTRAFMLLQLCTPEVLPNGKTINVARKAVVNHLRRPNFEVELVTGMDAEMRDKTLLQFHHLLKAGGFR